jgi:hypothetical protein
MSKFISICFIVCFGFQSAICLLRALERRPAYLDNDRHKFRFFVLALLSQILVALWAVNYLLIAS